MSEGKDHGRAAPPQNGSDLATEFLSSREEFKTESAFFPIFEKIRRPSGFQFAAD